MNRRSIILLMLCHCYCELVINSNKSVTGIVGKFISLKWEMKNDGNIYGPMVYINNWENHIIDTTGDTTTEGEKLFGKRISYIWNKSKPDYYYEVAIKNLSYSDAHIFQVRVVYEDESGVHIKQDNTSSINLEVKGVEKCGKQLEDTIEFEDNTPHTFRLCGNPKPKVSYEFNDGETHVVPGFLVDEKTKKYRYVVNITMQSFYCGKIIKYHFTGWKNSTHKVKLIPKRVEGVRYELNATNCTTVEWEQVNYGTCYPDVTYQLLFVKYNGSIYQRVTNMVNQTTFVDCQDKSLKDAHSVNVRAVHKDFTGKPSRNVTRTDIMDSRTTTPTVTSSGISPKSKQVLLIVVVSIVLLGAIIVFCFCMSKSRRKAEVERLSGKNLDQEKQGLQMESRTTETGNAKSPKSPSLDEDSPFIEDSSFMDIQQPISESEPTVSPIQPATPPPATAQLATPPPAISQPATRQSELALVKRFYGNEQLYALANESGKDP